jgi:hypothetical protein
VARIQKRGKTAKHLKRGKKLEAKKPLFVATEHGAGSSGTQTQPQTYLTYTLTDTMITKL